LGEGLLYRNLFVLNIKTLHSSGEWTYLNHPHISHPASSVQNSRTRVAPYYYPSSSSSPCHSMHQTPHLLLRPPQTRSPTLASSAAALQIIHLCPEVPRSASSQDPTVEVHGTLLFRHHIPLYHPGVRTQKEFRKDPRRTKQRSLCTRQRFRLLRAFASLRLPTALSRTRISSMGQKACREHSGRGLCPTWL